MGNVIEQIVVGFFCTLALSGITSRAEEISTNISEQTLAQHSSEVLGGMRQLGEKHGFTVAMEVENGNGKYILHIKQRHNETTERGLLRVDQTIIKIQSSIQELLRDLRRESVLNDAPLPVFSEGYIAPILNFRPIREDIEMLRRKARHADELFQLLREYYDKKLLNELESLRICELAAINFLTAQALKPSEKNLAFLCVKCISRDDATPDELVLMAGGPMKLHALGEVMLIPADGKEEITSALRLVYKEGKELFDTLSRTVLEWTPPAEHEELLALLRHSRSVHHYQILLSRLEKYAMMRERTTLLKQVYERANRVTESVFIARERKTVERIASYLGQSSDKFAPMVFGVDHNFSQAVSEWNNTTGYRVGLVTFTPNTETGDRGQ